MPSRAVREVHVICNQLVTIDNCCNPTQCGEPASHQHAPSGLALCAKHYGNAEKYCIDGTWTVGSSAVSFPEGWTAVAPASLPPPQNSSIWPTIYPPISSPVKNSSDPLFCCAPPTLEWFVLRTIYTRASMCAPPIIFGG